MSNMVRILLHRPFVSDGHLNSIAPEVAKSSFSICAAAATRIVQVIRLYDRAYTIRRAPYLISYATYLAATIHVRIAARRSTWSDAHDCLKTCLEVFEQNSETNHAVRKAGVVIESLMKRVGVSVERQGRHASSKEGSNSGPAADLAPAMQIKPGTHPPDDIAMGLGTGSDGFADDLDIDAIIESFVPSQSAAEPTDAVQPDIGMGADFTFIGQNGAAFGWQSWANGTDDTMFGFHSSYL